MTSKQKKKPGRTETLHQGGGAARRTHVTEFLRACAAVHHFGE